MEDVAMVEAAASDIKMISEAESLDEGSPDATDLQPVDEIQPAASQVAEEELADGEQEIGEALSVDDQPVHALIQEPGTSSTAIGIPQQSEPIYVGPQYLPIVLPVAQPQQPGRSRRRRLRRQRADPCETMQDDNYYDLIPSPERRTRSIQSRR
ncbi:hypothetical protein H4R24_000890 [Coemansia sp. RSA 988]|nr:hypothetical protein H4R24_000890 [Coemansia sp. RSA 988]